MSRQKTPMNTATPQSFGAHLMPTTDGLGMRDSTPPPIESPLPRTPKPQRFVSPPKTPIPSLTPSFGQDNSDNPNFALGMSISRPSSALSTCSDASDSSVDSNTTYTTTSASCTSVEDNEDKDTTPTDSMRKVSQGQFLTVPGQEAPAIPLEQKNKRKTVWTEEMDAHLWRTYALYQMDPKMTPFYLVPGQAPPLGVCHKVAREARRSWKEDKLNGTWRSPLPVTPNKSHSTRAVSTEPVNRGDALRKTSLYSFPASEASTRRRLRELCRMNYGPSRKPYHFHQQGRRTPAPNETIKAISNNVSPSPARGQFFGRAQDPLSSTRGMALSLATSTASSMRPGGVLASITAGRDVDFDSSGSVTPTGSKPQQPLPGIADIIQSATTRSRPTSLHESLASESRVSLDILQDSESSNRRASFPAGRTLLPPLELNSSGSLYSTWPRRLKRSDTAGDNDFATEASSDTSSTTIDNPPTKKTNTTIPASPQRRLRRGNVSDLFDASSEAPQPPLTTPFLKTRTRIRGHTISGGTNPFSTSARRRPRPNAPLLTVTGPVSYDVPGNAQERSPLAKREKLDIELGKLEGAGNGKRRLGSPFMERLLGRRK